MPIRTMPSGNLSPAPPQATPRFGFYHNVLPPSPDADTLEKAHKSPPSQTLLPQTTPVFLLHGTFATSHTLAGPARTFSKHPLYTSYSPEVRYSIDLVKASKMAARDMGAFRFQLINRQLPALQALQEKLSTTATAKIRYRLLGEHFDIIPERRSVLGPTLEKVLMNGLFEKSGNTPSLSQQTAEQMNRLYEEARKLSPHTLPPIIDTHWFFSEAEKRDRTVNWDPAQNHPSTINGRTISPEAVDNLEARLLQLEQSLVKGFAQALARKFTDPKLSQAVTECAEATARAVMNQVAPKGMAMGHSQGGTVVVKALINGLKDGHLHGSSYIGLLAPTSGAVQGLPLNPNWLSLPDSLARGTWKVASHRADAVMGTRHDSPVIQKIVANADLLDRKNLTSIAIGETHDGLVPLESALFPDAADHPNVFNWETTQPTLPINPDNPDKIFMIFLERLQHYMGEHPLSWSLRATADPESLDNPYTAHHMQLLEFVSKTPAAAPLQLVLQALSADNILTALDQSPAGWATRLILQGWKTVVDTYPKSAVMQWAKSTVPHLFDANAKRYAKNGMDQHFSPLVFSDNVFGHELGAALPDDGTQLEKTLHPSNFEPFRLQVLSRWQKRFRTQVLDVASHRNTTTGFSRLMRFNKQYPDFIPLLIANAAENSAVTNSAAQEALSTLTDIAGLIQQRVNGTEKPLGPQQQKTVRRILTPLTTLPALSSNSQTLQETAQSVLHTLTEETRQPQLA